MTTRTFAELANIIADDENNPIVLRRIRNFADKAIVPTLPGKGSKAARLDVYGAAIATIAVELTQHGFDADTLRKVAARFLKPSGFQPRETTIQRAVDAAIAGQDVTLIIRDLRFSETGQRTPEVKFEGKAFPPDDRVSKTLANFAEEHGIKSGFTETTVKVRPLLAPVIRAFAE